MDIVSDVIGSGMIGRGSVAPDAVGHDTGSPGTGEADTVAHDPAAHDPVASDDVGLGIFGSDTGDLGAIDTDIVGTQAPGIAAPGTAAMSTVTEPAVRLHFGCGTNTLPGWINIDQVARAPGVSTDLDLTDLPYANGSVDAVLAEHMLEHLSFAEEALVWREMARVLRPGGRLTLEVPDFEWVCTTFLAAGDDWRDFYRVGAVDHYAGCGRDLDQRWGILQTMFFGNQNGAGQFHRSGYTEGKLRALAGALGFRDIEVRRLFNKGGQSLRARLVR
jgi:predicted SAM-dependent methyltransferase